MGYNSELIRAIFIKKLGLLFPKKLRFRFYKTFYNYQSDSVNGIRLVLPYLKGYSFIVNTKDLIGWNIFFFGEYEADTNSILRKYIKEDFIVIEAGANNGSESILLGILATKGEVYAFEPVPHVYRDLSYNIDLNKLSDRITPVKMALGEINTEVTFHIFPESFCNQGMSSKYGGSPKTTSINVSQITLDKFCEEQHIKRIDMIKMDIQGAELDLIKGGITMIRQHRPFIFTEAADGWSNTLEIHQLLTSMQYNIYKIEQGGSLYLMGENIKQGNWLAIPSEKDKKTT